MKKHLNKFKTAAYVSIGIGSACFVGCLLYLVKVFCCTKKKAEDGNVQAKVMDMNPDANVECTAQRRVNGSSPNQLGEMLCATFLCAAHKKTASGNPQQEPFVKLT